MREVKKLNKEQLKAALTIAARCYPMMEANTLQKLDEIEARILKDFDSSKREWYGLFEDGVLLGNMVLYDYTVNFYGKDIKARGIGFVAVEFLHKKQKVARDMLSWYLKDSQEKKYSLALLYSFRPDFYKKMGFGYETSCYNFRTHPDRLPASKSDNPSGYIGIENLEEVTAFYAELYKANHGMIRKNPKDLENMLKAEGVNRVGCRENSKLTALMMFRLIANDSTNQTTHMKLDLLFSTPTALKTALGFLYNQADQVSEIDISTPYRDLFY
ncbi:MAG: GNAT family N-acetyltransferase [Candidatus Cloacimonetes bacterium]|nr:GNAT family N-acetyltransferase [Candidatus Cloacimonadota bacterium]